MVVQCDREKERERRGKRMRVQTEEEKNRYKAVSHERETEETSGEKKREKESRKAVKIKQAKWVDYINKLRKLGAKHWEREGGREEMKAQREGRETDKKKRKREEWVNSFWGLKLKQLNDPIIWTKQTDTSEVRVRCGIKREGRRVERGGRTTHKLKTATTSWCLWTSLLICVANCGERGRHATAVLWE